MLSYHKETALQGALVLAKSGRLKLENNIYGHGLSTCQLSHSLKKAKQGMLRRSRSFKLGHRGRYQSKARMRLSISD